MKEYNVEALTLCGDWWFIFTFCKQYKSIKSAVKKMNEMRKEYPASMFDKQHGGHQYKCFRVICKSTKIPVRWSE